MILLKIITIIILSSILTLFMPWYTPFIVCFIVGLIFSNKAGNNFIAGGLSIGIFWLIYALYLDTSNNQILSNKVAALFSDSLKTNITGSVLLMLTTFLGFILGGLSCMAGAMITDNGSRKRQRKAVKNGQYRLKIKYK